MERPQERIVGVRRLNEYLKLKFERDPNLGNVAVRGEVTNHSVLRGGHVSFELKEGDASLAAFVWQSDAIDLPPLRNGLSIVARGAVRTFPGRSRYQIYVTGVELTGIGDVHAQFEERRRRLTAEGLFAGERKRRLPKFPFAVALVSSRTSDGANDFATILRDRAPHVRIVWCETAVQGAAAAPEIATAIDRASRANVDAIVVTRGGGSFEDLFVFSDENVVRAIARARHPVVCAIGHTADQQLSDFVADRHFETPSAAAKGLGSETAELTSRVGDAMVRGGRAVALSVERLRGRLASALLRSKLADARLFFAPLAQRVVDYDGTLEGLAMRRVRGLETRLRDLGRRLDPFDPRRPLAERARRLDGARGRLDAAARARLVDVGARLRRVTERLEPAGRVAAGHGERRLALVRAHLDGNDPEAILQRGYAIVKVGSTIVRDAASVLSGTRIEAQLARGTLLARVESEGTDGNERSG